MKSKFPVSKVHLINENFKFVSPNSLLGRIRSVAITKSKIARLGEGKGATSLMKIRRGAYTGSCWARQCSSSRRLRAGRWPSRRRCLPRPGRYRTSRSARGPARSPWCASRAYRFPPASLYSPGACHGSGSTATLCTSSPVEQIDLLVYCTWINLQTPVFCAV